MRVIGWLWGHRFWACVGLISFLLVQWFLFQLLLGPKETPTHNALRQDKVPGHIAAELHSELNNQLPVPQTAVCADKAVIQGDLSPLLHQMGTDWHWQWIRTRIQTLWPQWQHWGTRLQDQLNMTGRFKRNIVVIPGVLRATEFAIPAEILQGAPLGDLVQWADLLAALHVLGHNVTLFTDFYEVGRSLRYERLSWRASSGCVTTIPDLIYADIISMKTFHEIVLEKYRCKFRVVDAYGTEAAFNDPQYSKKHGLETLYGQLGLQLKQFYTFYPHTPDNSFLGFVASSSRQTEVLKKEKMGVLYGKDPKYFRGREDYISLLLQWMEVHTTVSQNGSSLPVGVFNHGVVTAAEYTQLLHRAKFFIGVGRPMESTGVLEALAQGCVFLNPKYTPEEMGILHRNGKPTSRNMTSQVPYLEDRVGPPYVYTVNIRNRSQVYEAVQLALDSKNEGFTPCEFTMLGFLERLSLYIDKQDFCASGATWPPVSSVRVALGRPGNSCSQACHQIALVCEPVHFSQVNHKEAFQRYASKPCVNSYHTADIYYPALVPHNSSCILQQRESLFSCSGGRDSLRRLCPCRDFVPQQVALCKDCFNS